jgi:hypothetical protein
MFGMSKPLQRWRRLVRSWDFHLLMTLLSRSWSILAGAITLVLLPLGLDPLQQGFYFTFSSLLALQVLLELGLSQVVIQLVGKEAAYLTQDESGVWHGPESHLARLATLQKLLHKWYAIASIAFVGLVGLAGWVFFGMSSAGADVAWAGPWIVVVLATGLNLYSIPGLACNEGLGHVGQVARLRLIQSALGYSLMWVSLFSGVGLWCIVAVPLCSGLVSWYWLRARGRLRQRIPEIEHSRLLNWRDDIFPLQWRIAASWICGYFIFNLFTPTTFAVWGAEQAGQIGMALLVFSSIASVGTSCVSAKFPLMVKYIELKEYGRLNQTFRASMWQALGISAVFATGFVAIVWVLQDFRPVWADRLASIEILVILAGVCVVNTAVFAMASYMRAYQVEPMLPVSLVSALLTTLVVLVLQNSLIHMMLGYGAICLFVSFPWTITLYRSFRRAASSTKTSWTLPY